MYIDDEAYEILMNKMSDLTYKNIKLQRDNNRMASKIRGYKKSIGKYKDQIDRMKEKQPKNKKYKNGKRGTKYNG